MFRLALQRRLYSRKPPVPESNWWAEQLQSHEVWIKPKASSPIYWWQRWRLRWSNA